MQVAKTILSQMGGNRFIAMTGSKNFAGDDNSLKFNFPKIRKANTCRITLNSLDLYDVEFFKYNRKTFDCPSVDLTENVYHDKLQEIFTGYTGLYTSL
ncbi:MAG: hypothetical protein ABUK08_00405 [Candidatus Humimicrobiaceae bacterium]